MPNVFMCIDTTRYICSQACGGGAGGDGGADGGGDGGGVHQVLSA